MPTASTTRRDALTRARIDTAAACFFCEEARDQLSRARGFHESLLLAGLGDVQAARRVRSQVQRLERALGRHSCDGPRRSAAV